VARPKLLDLFCGAGGCSVGYDRAGFDVTGVDVRPQPRYPFRFIQADALAYVAGHGHEYDAIHASPPCQAYSTIGTLHRDRTYPDLVAATRDALDAVGRPWIIENVPGAPMRRDVTLCGSMFGLGVRRHRWFEGSPMLPPWTPPCNHSQPITGVYGHSHGKNDAWNHGRKQLLRSDLATWNWAMGIDWMTAAEITQAIPPAYTVWLGRHLRAAVTTPAWVPCADGCGDFWCRVHDEHALGCACPAIEEWDVDPYDAGGPKEGEGHV
jgi:DNA (cytosine-5)-methyltransferase 1